MRIQFSLRLLLAAVLVIACVCFALRWCLGPIRSPVVLSRLKPGMTGAEVEQLLGVPFDRRPDAWYFNRPKNPGWLTVYFDDEGRFTRYAEERAFP